MHVFVLLVGVGVIANAVFMSISLPRLTSHHSTSFAWTGKGDDAYAKYTEMQFTSGTPCWQGEEGINGLV